VQPNPWDKVAERYPPGVMIEGVVRNLTNYGALSRSRKASTGLLHCQRHELGAKSRSSQRRGAERQKVKCVILNVDQERSASPWAEAMASDPWEGDIPGRLSPGRLREGKVTS